MESPRTAVQKCTVVFSRSVRAWIATQEPRQQFQPHPGLVAATGYVQALTIMCLTGNDLGISDSDISKLPPGARSYHKFFLRGWSENDTFMRAIRQASRVRTTIDFFAPDGLKVTTVFFKKGAESLGSAEVFFDLKTGKTSAVLCL